MRRKGRRNVAGLRLDNREQLVQQESECNSHNRRCSSATKLIQEQASAQNQTKL